MSAQCLQRAWVNAVRLWQSDEDGATTVEYAFMLAAILIFCMGMITAVGVSNQNAWNTVSNGIGTALSSAAAAGS